MWGPPSHQAADHLLFVGWVHSVLKNHPWWIIKWPHPYSRAYCSTSPQPHVIGKNIVNGNFPTFSRTCIVFLLTLFSPLWSTLFLSSHLRHFLPLLFHRSILSEVSLAWNHNCVGDCPLWNLYTEAARKRGKPTSSKKAATGSLFLLMWSLLLGTIVLHLPYGFFKLYLYHLKF